MTDVLERLRAGLEGRYLLEREIGRGGMATVFVARDQRHGRTVAVKVLHPELAATLGADRFVREIGIAAALAHPHILPLHDSGSVDGLLYYVMPFVEGESLRERLDREGALPIADALRIAGAIGEALGYAHARGIVHRDVKPENILLNAGHALLADFGIARALDAATGARLTGTGTSVGTPAYMSPEQSAGDPADARSDQYSLACVLYEMLTGEPPFTGHSVQAVIAKRFSEPPPHARTLRRTVPELVDDAIITAMATAPADRFPTVAGFVERLEAEAPRQTTRASMIRSARLPVISRRALAAGMAVVVAGIAAWSMWGRDDVRGRSPTRVAVLPFEIHGGAGRFAYLQGGMVDLLSRNLDGLGRLRAVDAATVLASAREAGTSQAQTPARARALARGMGARWYVVGSVHVNAGQFDMRATLFDVDEDTAGVASAHAVGDTASLFALVDSLTVDLVAGQSRAPGTRLTATAARTSYALPALKSYLQGEDQLRAAAYDSAARHFRDAVALDSGFALAYYRLAVSTGLSASRLGARWDPAVAASARALQHAARLGDRERRLLEAYDAYIAGRADDAEQRYRAILDDYPDDLEAKFQLAETLMRYNPPRGRPSSDARRLYADMARLDQQFFCYI